MNNKNLKCEFCNKRFGSEHSIKQHLVAKHNSKHQKFGSCKICGLGFNADSLINTCRISINPNILYPINVGDYIMGKQVTLRL